MAHRVEEAAAGGSLDEEAEEEGLPCAWEVVEAGDLPCSHTAWT